jgi:hypothetical protein
MSTKRQRKMKAKARRHAERSAKPKLVKDQQHVLEPGEARQTIVESVHGDTTRVVLEYQTHSSEYPDGSLGKRIAAEMYGAARMIDIRVLAMQRPGDIIEGEILTPDGRTVLTKWIPLEHELLMLSSRPSTAEDLATLDRYGEAAHEVEPRKAEARRVIAELEARQGVAVKLGEGSVADALARVPEGEAAVESSMPSILEAAQA